MIEIEGDLNGFIEVKTNTMWDQTINNNIGGHKLVVSIEPGWQLTSMQTDLFELKNKVEKMQKETDEEVMLRSTNAGLKDAYEKYQVIYKLVKETVDTLEGENGA